LPYPSHHRSNDRRAASRSPAPRPSGSPRYGLRLLRRDWFGAAGTPRRPGTVRPPFGQPARTPAWSRARARSPAGLARPAGGACLYDTQRRVV